MRLKGELAYVYKCAFTHSHRPTPTYTQIMLGLGNLFHLFCQLQLNEHMGFGNKSIVYSTSIYWLPILGQWSHLWCSHRNPGLQTPPFITGKNLNCDCDDLTMTWHIPTEHQRMPWTSSWEAPPTIVTPPGGAQPTSLWFWIFSAALWFHPVQIFKATRSSLCHELLTGAKQS